MPIYEYICESCEQQLEVIQKVSDEPLTLCPSCNKAGLKKITSISAFHLKGGGWYKDGYGTGSSNGSSNGTKTDGTTSKPAAESGEKSSTSKPAAESGEKSAASATKTKSKASTTSDSTPKTKAS